MNINSIFSIQSVNSSNQFFKNVQKRQEYGSTISLRQQHHAKIRIRQIQRKKKQKRKQLQTNRILQELLNVQFPKQHNDARKWAANIINVYLSSKNYFMDPHKLRQIFLLAQKFPNICTLRLLYLAIQNSSPQNTLTLFDFDVMKLLHNILKFPDISLQKNKQIIGNSQIITQQTSFSPASSNKNNIDLKFVQIQFIQLTLYTIIQLYRKGQKFRNFSIQNHKTYSGYILNVYKKYNFNIKTQIIDFLQSVFTIKIKVYSSQYLKMYDLINKLYKSYGDIFEIFLKYLNWKENQIHQTIEEATVRASNLIGLIYEILSKQTQKYLLDYVAGKIIESSKFYLKILLHYICFAQFIIYKFQQRNYQHNSDNNYQGQSESQNSQKYYKTYISAIQLFHNCIVFFSQFNQKILVDSIDGNEYAQVIPLIIKKISLFLYYLSKYQEKKQSYPYNKFIYVDNQLIQKIQKSKRVCLFVLTNAIYSNFSSYTLFVSKFLFFQQNNQQINIIQTVYGMYKHFNCTKVLYQLIQISFSFLSISFQPQTSTNHYTNFQFLKQIIQFLCQILFNKIYQSQIKNLICTQFINFLQKRRNSIFYNLVNQIILENYQKIQMFINNNQWNKDIIEEVEKMLDEVRNNMKIGWEDSNNLGIII